MTNKEKVVEVKNLSIDFDMPRGFFKKDKLSAINNVSLDVYKGDIFGVVGESGCGKSTLCNAILGFTPITSGTVTVLSKKIYSKVRSAELKKYREPLQIVFQNPYSSLNPRMEVWELIAEPLVIKGEIDRLVIFNKVVSIMEKVGLDKEDAHRNIFEFSGGQRQRIAIARALISEPKILICDEPVSALDVSVHAQICNLLLDLKDKFDLTYIFVSHNLSLIKHITNRMCVMYLGQIMEMGDTEEIFNNPKHPYTKALFNSILQIDEKKDLTKHILKGEITSPINAPSTCRFIDRCSFCTDKCKSCEHKLKEISENHLCSCVLDLDKNDLDKTKSTLNSTSM